MPSHILIRERQRENRQMHQEGDVKMEVETGVMWPPAQERQELPVATRSCKRKGKTLSQNLGRDTALPTL